MHLNIKLYFRIALNSVIKNKDLSLHYSFTVREDKRLMVIKIKGCMHANVAVKDALIKRPPH